MVSTVLKGCTIRQDAELANAVLLDLLRGSWISVPLQIVTHDFCNDHVVAALVSRNIKVAPVEGPMLTKGNCIVFPDEFRLPDRMTSRNGRYNARSRALSADSNVLEIITIDNVVCFSLLLPSSSLTTVIWSARNPPPPKWFNTSRQRAILQRKLLLTDAGELEEQHEHDDGSCVVVWSSGNRLVKLDPTSLAPVAAAEAVAGADTARSGHDLLQEQWEAIAPACVTLSPTACASLAPVAAAEAVAGADTARSGHDLLQEQCDATSTDSTESVVAVVSTSVHNS